MSPTDCPAATTSTNLWMPLEMLIVDTISEIRDVFTLVLSTPTDFAFRPGQFNMLYVPGFGESAISISSDADRPQQICHTIRAVGNVTRELQKFGSGERLLLRGPFGTAWPVDFDGGQDIVIACGGLGLAPLRPMVYHLMNRREQFGTVRLLYGARTPADLLYREEYPTWEQAGIEVRVTVDQADPNWRGPIGFVTQLMRQFPWRPQHTAVLACGPEVMMRYVALEALGQQVDRHKIFLSMERNMNCAAGLCGHCQFGPSFVCKDGPVYTYGQLEPFLHIEDL